MIIGQAILMAFLLASRSPRTMTIPLILLQVSVVGYLVKSSPVLAGAVPFAEIPLFIVACSSSYLVWLCAKILFGFDKPPMWAIVLFPSLTAIGCGFQIIDNAAPSSVMSLCIVSSLIVLAHAFSSVIRGNVDDLCEPRRRFRLYFVASISLASMYIMVMELVFIGQEPPSWVSMSNVLLIAVVFLGISIPLITRSGDLLPANPPPDGSKSSDLDAADQETHKALVRAMDNRAFARTGLTIRQLAEELRVPEHHLRTLINTRLGYKNFSSFLNGYRIGETCERLRDVKEARIPILTIALDAGFASLAPFNRAFRLSTGMTPSEYRRQRLRSGAVVTPINRVS
jgi:AraC-like DNA-binding protein